MPALTHANNQILDLKRLEYSTETKILSEDQGIVEAITSVTNVMDDVNDIILPGAYADTLSKRNPKIVWSHSWDLPVAKTLNAEELMPGDPRLPEPIQALGGGGLLVKMQFNLDTQQGRDAFSNVKFFGDESEWSIGYVVPAGRASIDQKTGVRKIRTLELFECSPVLFGAHANTVTMDVKKAIPSHNTGTSDKSWDGPSMKSNLSNDDGAGTYRKAFAWVDPSEDKDVKSSYKFIHHFVSSDGTVGDASTVACSTGIGVLNGGRGGTVIPDTDKEGVYNHLAKHLKDAGKDVPELKTLDSDSDAASLGTATDANPDPDGDGDDDRVTEPHMFIGFYSNPSVCSTCGNPKSHSIHKRHKKDAEDSLEEKPYEIQKDGDQYCVVNQSTGKRVPGGCHDTRAEAEDHMRALYANVPDAEKAMATPITQEDIKPHTYVPSMQGDNGSPCNECGLPMDSSVHSVKSAEMCNGEFTISIAGASASANCQKAMGHKGSHGFNYGDEGMSIKQSENADGQEVSVEKSPSMSAEVQVSTDATLDDSTEVAEELVNKVEEGTEKIELPEDKVVVSEPEVKEITEVKEANVSDKLTTLLQGIDGQIDDLIDELNIVDPDEDDNQGDATSTTSLVVQALDAQVDMLMNLLGISDPDDDTEKGKEVRLESEEKTNVTNLTINISVPKEGKVSPEELAKEINFVLTKTGSDDSVEAGTVAEETNDSEEVVEEKVNVSLNGSFEDTTSKLMQALDGVSPNPVQDGASCATWIEATFPDSVLVACVDYMEDETDDGLGYIDYLGMRYFSYPYTMTDGNVSFGTPKEVDVAGVLVPKSGEPEELATKTVSRLESKVGRTLSAGNADKIKQAVVNLIEVLSAAGIEVNEKEAETEEVEEKSVVSAIELLMMENDLLRLMAES